MDPPVGHGPHRARDRHESVVARSSHPAVVLSDADVVRRARVSRPPLDVRRRRHADRVRAAAPRPPGRASSRQRRSRRGCGGAGDCRRRARPPLDASIKRVAALRRRAAASAGRAARLDLRAQSRESADGRRQNDHLRVRSTRRARSKRRRASRYRSTDDDLRRRIGDVRRGAPVGGDDSGARRGRVRRADGQSRRPRLRERSGVPPPRTGAAAIPPAALRSCRCS